MKMCKLRISWNRIFFVLFLTLFCLQSNYGQDREKKINVVVDSLRTVESMKATYIRFGLKPLKFEASNEDSIKLVEIENLLTDEEIRRRIIQGLNETFTNNEIDDLYSFVKTIAFHKLFYSSLTNKNLSNQFKDIRTELARITTNIESKNQLESKATPKFEPIPVERDDGFYETIDYDSNSENKDVKLEKTPAIKKEDILEAKRDTNNSDSTHIEITLNKTGARRFHFITKNNIGKPIAIVLDKHIVSMPIVNTEISGGKVSISGNFTNEEVEQMIERLKHK